MSCPAGCHLPCPADVSESVTRGPTLDWLSRHATDSGHQAAPTYAEPTGDIGMRGPDGREGLSEASERFGFPPHPARLGGIYPSETNQQTEGGPHMSAHWHGSDSVIARRWWAPRVAAGGMTCYQCGRPISPADAWDVEHMTPLAHGGHPGRANQAVSHSRCNRAAGQAIGQATMRRRRAQARRMRPW